MENSQEYYTLDPAHTDPARMRRERDTAKQLRKTQWWLDQLNRGVCHYCTAKFRADELTMDHVVPLARGGTSSRGNIVAACKSCNQDKKLSTPVEDLFKLLAAKKSQDAPSDPT